MVTFPARKRRRLSSGNSSEDSTLSTIVEPSNTPGVDDFFTSASRWNLEQDYESRPRKQKENAKENTRLPIKTAEGRIQQAQIPETKDDDQDRWLESEKHPRSFPGEANKADEDVAQVPVRQQISDAKEELARVAILINEDPEEHAGGFRTLAQVASSRNITVKKLALATQLAVYKDVIPGYRIRPLAETDMAEKVSKEVRRLRAFEQALVGSYQIYIKELARNAKGSRESVSETIASISTVAISCACALLLAKPHFNFRGELLKILVNKLSTKKIDRDFIKCRETLQTLFANDEDGIISLDAVMLLTRMMKARDYRMDESVLDTFLDLRLLSEFSFKGSQNYIDNAQHEGRFKSKRLKAKKEFRTKKQRKIDKERKVVQKEFTEADAIVNHEQRDKMQAETLKLVFTTYFRILKARASGLVGAGLEGLAKYAHLINQDFFGDLLEALKEITMQADAVLVSIHDDQEHTKDVRAERDAMRESLLCTITAFALVEGQDASKAVTMMSLDLSFFIAYLYRTLYSLALNPDIELSAQSLRLPDPYQPINNTNLSSIVKNKVNIQTTIVLLLRSLSSVLLPPVSTRAVPPVRVAAFSKQLLTSSLQLPEKSATAMLGLMNKVATTHARKISGMWNTEERKGNGVFDPMRGDLEASNPFASTVWEGEMLRLHYCPAVREAVKMLEKSIWVGGRS
ncbi:hypothetical protein MMC06_000056 [Schaereria dolodes]|nr:hypothetical protein [Schaereria dolodes]